MLWDRDSRRAYALRRLRVWCSDVLDLPVEGLDVRPRRARHGVDRSIFSVTVRGGDGLPHDLSFEVHFDEKESEPSFARVAEHDAATGKWRTIVDLSRPTHSPDEAGPSAAPALSSRAAVALLLISIAICSVSGFAVLTRIGSMMEGISAYFWSTAEGVRGEGDYTYSFTLPGESSPRRSTKFDALMRLRGGRELGVGALQYASLQRYLRREPLVVHVNPVSPERSVLKPGIPTLAAAQMIVFLTAFIPALMVFLLALGGVRGKPVPDIRRKSIWISLSFYTVSTAAAMLYMSAWSYVLRSMPPALPLAVLGVGSAVLFIFPGLARTLYASAVVRRGVYFIVGLVIMPPVLALIGLSLPYVLALIALMMSVTVLAKPFARADRKPLYAVLISLFWLPVMAAGLLAPCRALVQVLHEALPHLPYNIGLTGLEDPRAMAYLDVGVGGAGIVIGLLYTYIDSQWRGRQAALVEELPTSRARSVAIGLVELEGRARHLDENGRGPILSYDSRHPDANRNEPFYLEDDSGRILVDPRGCRFRTGWRASLGGRIVEIVLLRREQKPDLHRPHTMTLLPGDSVYVIGSAQPRDDADSNALGSDRLVVRRRPGGIFNSPIWLAAQGRIKPGHEAEDVFFLTDTGEHVARARIMRGMWQVWAWALLWIAMGLLMIHFQLPRTRPGYSLWTMEEIIRNTSGTSRIEAVLDYLRRHSEPVSPPALEYVGQIPVVGPMVGEIHENLRYSQLSEGTNFLWGYKFPDASEEETDMLLRALESKSWDARRWAASRLEGATRHAHRVVPPLAGVIGGEDDVTIRAAAAKSLASFGPDALPAVAVLVRAARSTSPDLSRNALWTVAKMPGITGGDAYELFLDCLEDEDSERRRLGVQGLTAMGEHAGESAARLLSLTSDENQYVRALSLKALRSVAPDYPGFVDAVVRALSDPEDVVRHEASYQVYDMPEPPSEVAAPLGEMITDKYVSDRVNHILSRMGPRAAPAASALARALGHKDAKIAYNAAFTLSRIGGAAAPALDALIGALEHDDPYVRRYSAQAIGNIGPDAERAVAVLETLMADKDAHVRSSAQWALNRIRKGS